MYSTIGYNVLVHQISSSWQWVISLICGNSVTTTASQQQCHNNSVTTTVSQQQHHNNSVTTAASQQQCHNNSVTTTVSQQQCHNSKCVIFKDRLLKVLKCYNFL